MGNIRYVVDPQAPGKVGDALAKFLDKDLGPQIVQYARNVVPVKTGALYRSITHEVYRAENDESILFVGIDEEAEGVDYGAYVELGTSRQAAQPYLRPAIYQAAARIR